MERSSNLPTHRHLEPSSSPRRPTTFVLRCDIPSCTPPLEPISHTATAGIQPTAAMHQRVEPSIRVSGEELDQPAPCGMLVKLTRHRPPSTEPSYSLKQYLESGDKGVPERLMDGKVGRDAILVRYGKLNDELEELAKKVSGS